MKNCENCNSLTDESYASGRFCSKKCARGFSTKSNRQEINKKVSSSLMNRPSPRKGTGTRYGILENRICSGCRNIFIAKYNTHTFCSNKCSRIGTTIETKNKISKKAKERVKNGTHQGWQSRKVRSYAEIFFEKVLNNNNINKYSVEHKIKKSDLGFKDVSNYFLDFYFPDLKLDLEIDGKQHNYPERKISDKNRDESLNQYGIEVYRIKWKNPNTEINKKYIKNEIDKFLEFYAKRKKETQLTAVQILL